MKKDRKDIETPGVLGTRLPTLISTQFICVWILENNI